MAKVKLLNVRLSFPELFEPKEYTPGDGKPRYDATYLIEKDSENDKKIRNAIAEAAKDAWGEKPTGTKKVPAYKAKLKAMAGDTNKFCYHDGDTKDREEYENHMIITGHRAAKQGAPAVIDRAKNKLTAADGKPYSGCYVNATIDMYIQGGQWPGVRCTLIGVQFVADGDAFAGAQATDDDFDDLGNDEEDDDMDEFTDEDMDDTSEFEGDDGDDEAF